jgi:hypothetical protein
MFPHSSGDTRPGYQLPTGTFLDLSVVRIYILEGANIYNRASPFYYGTAVLRLNDTGLCHGLEEGLQGVFVSQNMGP